MCGHQKRMRFQNVCLTKTVESGEKAIDLKQNAKVHM